MNADYEPAGSAPPKDGDFVRYLDDLVNRGRPAPGAVGDAATFDANRLLRRLATWQRPASAGQARPPAPGGPARPSADTPPELSQRAVRATRVLMRLASRLLLTVSAAWLVLALVAEIPFFADSVPIAIGLLFLSLYLRPGRPASPTPPRT
jgi:hypothetical protein